MNIQKQPPKVFYKRAVLKNLAIFTGKHLCWSLFLIKLLYQKRLQHRCLPVNIAKFLRTSILKNIYERMPLNCQLKYMKQPRFHEKIRNTSCPFELKNYTAFWKMISLSLLFLYSFFWKMILSKFTRLIAAKWN